jgi:hypothetical protein
MKKPKGRRDEHTLPDDVHFTSKELVTLFLKPKFSVRCTSLFTIMEQSLTCVLLDIAANAWAACGRERGRRG